MTDTASVAPREKRRPPMCYTRKAWDREEEARRLRAKDQQIHVPSRGADVRSARHEHKEEKSLTKKVKEVVGVR